MWHLKGKNEFRAAKGSASQASAAVGSACRRETVHMEPLQDSRPESTYDPADMSHLDTHTLTPRSCGISVTSSLADSDLNSALVESRRGVTKLKDIVAKKLTDYKADNPRLCFYDFLEVEVVQLTSDSYDEFQQETFNLVMRLKRSDKQQRYNHAMGMSTAAYSQASNQYPLSHTQMQALCLCCLQWVSALMWNVIALQHYWGLVLYPKVILLTCGVSHPQQVVEY